MLILLTITFFVAYNIAYMLTEGSYILQDKFPRIGIFKHKPFTCFPCTNFWISNIFQMTIGIFIFNSLTYCLFCVIISFIIFIKTHYEYKNKIE
jgi:hypothetical protein